MFDGHKHVLLFFNETLNKLLIWLTLPGNSKVAYIEFLNEI